MWANSPWVSIPDKDGQRKYREPPKAAYHFADDLNNLLRTEQDVRY